MNLTLHQYCIAPVQAKDERIQELRAEMEAKEREDTMMNSAHVQHQQEEMERRDKLIRQQQSTVQSLESQMKVN